MSLLNVGARALLANQVALQTAGHNIANVNTPGYSRQTVVLQTVQGQFTGGGYIGQGVDVQTILRNQSELLTRQSATAGSVQSSDIVRAERLRQLQEVFSGGTAGLGAAINDMMNAFSDVVSAPTDITARTVVLTRMDETASRMRAAADRINEIQYTVTEQLQSSITAVNSLAGQMASVNEQIARAKGNGQTPNDLLDQRDQIIRDINQYVQTTQIPADDGTVGLFVAGSQPLVLGTTATSLSIDDATAFPGSGQIKLFFNRPGAPAVEMDENVLGGGSMSGLLRFNNNDLAEGRNLLGRMAMAIGMTMNDQHNLGLTLDGALGKDLFALPASMRSSFQGAALAFRASLTNTQLLILAAIVTSNGGTLQLAGLKATGLPNPPGLVLPPNANPAALPPILGGIQLQFTAGPPTTYDVLDRGTAPPTTIAAAQPYTPGAPISINGWEIKLQGSPNTGDTVVIGNASDPQYGDIFTRNAGNASALMGLRDVKMFDESTLSDGYAGAMAQVGTRTQSALFAAELSTTIAANLERDRTAISGVNLDEEAARLIQYQQAYQASSKMIQIAQNIFDSLLQGLGR